MCIINVSTKCMQWNCSFTVTFRTCDVCAAKTTRNFCFDSFSSSSDRSSTCLFLSSSERYTVFKLTCDTFCYQFSIHIHFFNFDYIYVYFFAGKFVKSSAELVDLATTFTNYHAWLACMKTDVHSCSSALNFHFGNCCVFKIIFDIFTDFKVFVQKICKFFVCIPFCFQVPDDACTMSNRIYLLTQINSLLVVLCVFIHFVFFSFLCSRFFIHSFRNYNCNVACTLVDFCCASLCTWTETFQCRTFV